MRFRASEAAAAIGGALVGPDVTIHGVAFDSRMLRPGQLFVALRGERDGHEFLADAVERGAAAVLAQRPAASATSIVVAGDTLRALMDLAAAMRRRFAGTVVGITGSVGKTSTKDLCWAAVGASRRTAANAKSFNNEQGLPTTVLNAADDTEVLVLEMGMRAAGEITELCAIAHPSIGLVTRVAEAHSDRVGGLDGVARAKAELVAALPERGTAILNADDHRVLAMAGQTRAAVLTFGAAPTADVRLSRLRLDELARPRFVVDSPWGAAEVRLSVSGAHMAVNAAGALAVVGALGADLTAGAAALAEVQPGAQRMAVRPTAAGGTVLDDSYNANPTSMRAGLDALAELPAARRVAVVGVMAEIADAAAEHRAIVDYAAARGIDIIAVGTDLYGVDPCDDPVAAVGSVAGGHAVLVKGSRVAGLERVAEALVERA